MRQLLLLCTTFFALQSCNNPTTTNQMITISVDLNQAIDIASSTDFTVREINLDEKDGVNTRYSILSSVIPIESKLIFFTDSGAYVLDNDGNLIRKMGDRGNAANEYIKIWSLFLKKDGGIVINDSNKLLEYSSKGEFIKKYDVATFAGQELPLVGDNFYCVGTEFNVAEMKSKSHLQVLNQGFELVQRVDSLRLPMQFWGCISSNTKDFLFLSSMLKLSILTSNFTIEEKYNIDLGVHNPILSNEGEILSEEASMENFTKRASLGGALRDTENALYFDVMCNNALFLVKYDKKENQTTSYKVFETDSPFISNNNKFHNNHYGYIRSSEDGMMAGVVTIND